MSPFILTKIAKFMMIGSLSAYLSFASKNNYSVRLFFFYSLGGIVLAFLLAILWESRDYLIADNPTEESLTTLVSGLSNSCKPKRQYYLSAQVRLEIVIALVTIAACALIGGI
jgi:hypothetical protein